MLDFPDDWRGAKIAHIVVAGGRATAPNAELMALEMSVATALMAGCSSLVYFMDSTVTMSDLVDLSPHSSQGSSLAVCNALRGWFSADPTHVFHLWHISSKEEWKVHHDAHKVAKAAQIPLCPGCRVSFDFIQTTKEAAYWREWNKDFSDLGNQGHNFLPLVGFNSKPLKPMSLKGGVWSQFLVSGSNSLTARAYRATVGHAPIGEYCLHFHPGELALCQCPSLVPGDQEPPTVSLPFGIP